MLATKWQDYVVCIVNENGNEITVSGMTPAKDGTVDWRLKIQRSDLKFFSTGLGESDQTLLTPYVKGEVGPHLSGTVNGWIVAHRANHTERKTVVIFKVLGHILVSINTLHGMLMFGMTKMKITTTR